VIESTEELLLEFVEKIDYKDSSAKFDSETYTHKTMINIGPSCDYILQRKSDKKFFKINIWENSSGYEIDPPKMIEVFEKSTITYE
jgi:hypothetical protein